MALQSSGAISLADVQTEFGGSNPIGIDEYYGVAAGIPASGTISLANFYGTGAFSGWTYGVLGLRGFESSSISSDSFTGNTITPGSGNSPKTFSINQSRDGSISAPPPYPTLTLQYYQGGSLNTTWTLTVSSGSQNQSASFLATFGSSSIRFDSSITDPSAYDDISASNNVYTGAGSYYATVMFVHIVNLIGAGQYDVDYDD